MMEGSRIEKRVILDDVEAESQEPILVRVDRCGSGPRDIRIDKDEVLAYFNCAFLSENLYHSHDSFHFLFVV